LGILFSCHFLQSVGFEIGTTTVHFLAVIAVQQRHCFHLSVNLELQPQIIYEVNRYEQTAGSYCRRS
jgi:hypothetical protein